MDTQWESALLHVFYNSLLISVQPPLFSVSPFKGLKFLTSYLQHQEQQSFSLIYYRIQQQGPGYHSTRPLHVQGFSHVLPIYSKPKKLYNECILSIILCLEKYFYIYIYYLKSSNVALALEIHKKKYYLIHELLLFLFFIVQKKKMPTEKGQY